jgi:hypothetical protein
MAGVYTIEVQTLDTFLTMITAGVVGALLGAIVAFYLGGALANHKHILAKQREEQLSLEQWRIEEQRRLLERKQRERQRERERKQRLIDRRAEALDDIRIQALTFGYAFRTWTDRAANLKVPPKDEVEQAAGFSKELADLIQQADEVSTELAFLRGHYNAHSSILEQRSGNIIESFQKQGIERHSFLSNQLKATAASLQPLLALLQPDQVVDVLDRTSHSDAISWLAGSSLGMFVSPRKSSGNGDLWNANSNKETIPEKQRQEVLQAANVANDWDIDVHLRALDAEVGRLEGNRG